MPLFSYKVKDNKGKLIEDVLQATNKTDAVSILKADGYQILTIKPLDKGFGAFGGGRISITEKATFCRFLATMLRAGLPLPEAVDIIREETKSPKLKKIIFDISFQIRKGSTLSSVLAKYKTDFDPVFLTMVKAGEESGTLDKSFDYLAKELLSSYELSQKVKGALMYPAVIVVAMMANFVIMLVFVLPKLAGVFTQLNLELPLPTKILLGFGSFVGDNTFLVMGVLVALVILTGFSFVYQPTRDFFVSIFIRLPGVKKVVMQLDIARFSSTLSTLLRNGVPIIVALDVSSDLIRQPALKKESKEFSKGVAGGVSLSEILGKGGKAFPSTVVSTIKAGEKTGSLEDVLEEMSQFYEKEVDYGLKRLTALLEPLLMLVIGLAVGAMVVIMITPIYSLVSGFGSSY